MTLRSANDLLGNRVHAVDGEIGDVRDFYFDDDGWSVLYFVIDTGEWLPGRKVLVTPFALGEVDWMERRFDLQGVTKEMVEASPHIDLDQPVTRDQEVECFSHFGWPCFWQGRLHGQEEIIGRRVEAGGEEVGTVAGMLVDDQTWWMPYAVVDATRLSPGKRVLIPRRAVERMDWPGRSITLNIMREQIIGSPEYDQLASVSRDYEAEVYKHFGLEPYWS